MDSYAESTPKALIQSDVWFADGNIVLIADCASFKVHRSVLERHSQMFHDLFAIPQPLDQSLIDGCPWVELHDRPSDLHHLLTALYGGLDFKDHSTADFVASCAVLRLSTKYFIEHLREHCIDRIARYCPMSLSEWDRRDSDLKFYDTREFVPHPILILELAFELNLDAFLPSAFYDVARGTLSKIFAGTHVPPPVFSTDSNPQDQQVRLSDAILSQTFAGRDRAQVYINVLLEDLLHDRPSADCLNAGTMRAIHCVESFYFLHLNILRYTCGVAGESDADPLHTLLLAVEMLDRRDFSDGVRTCGLDLCAPCKAAFREYARKARLEVWKLIPEWFGLQG